MGERRCHWRRIPGKGTPLRCRYQAYPYSKTTKTDPLMCYYDNHCLAFPETVLMYREVSGCRALGL